MADVDLEHELREFQREYVDFLDDDVRKYPMNVSFTTPAFALCLHVQQDEGIYTAKVREMIREGRSRLIVSVNDLRRKNPKRWAT